MRLLLFLAALSVSASVTASTPRNRAAAAPTVAPTLTGPDALDTRTYAHPEIARVTHVALDLAAEFEAHRMAGTATLDIQAAPGAREIVLDSKGLEIAGVTGPDGRALPFTLGANDPTKGQPLTVQIGPSTGSGQALRRIVVHYRSGADAEALQWLTPEQ